VKLFQFKKYTITLLIPFRRVKCGAINTVFLGTQILNNDFTMLGKKGEKRCN